MARSTDQIRVAAEGDLHLAPYGTTLPPRDDPRAELDPAFYDLGYLTEEGVETTKGVTFEAIRGWQSVQDLRRIVTERSYSIAGQMQQWNKENFALAFDGGEWTEEAPGVWCYDPPDDADSLAVYSGVLDWQDGEHLHRVVVKAATITDEVTTQLTRTGATVLPVTINALTPEGEAKPWYHVTSDAAFAEGS